MIVFDLEWTRPFEQESMEEIIQIGAVKIDKLGGPITDSFTVYIRPSVYQELRSACLMLLFRRAQKLYFLMPTKPSWIGAPTIRYSLHGAVRI